METRIPATVLGGFLGSGKTTLLNRLLRDRHGLRVAVIVNEFGEVGIDGAAITGATQFVELDNGCLCCAINEDLQRTLRDLAARGGFDHLVLETTGLADPLLVGWTFSKEGLIENYRLDSLVTVVDALNLDTAIKQAPEAELQVARADLLVLNKMDLVGDAGAAAIATVRSINRRAPLVEATLGDVPWEFILSCDRQAPSPSEQTAHTHTPSFETYTFRTDAVVSEQRLEDFLYEVVPGVYRMKAIVRTDGADPWVLVNSVAGRFEIDPFEGPPEKGAALVFIGRELDRDKLEKSCRELLIAGAAS
jgi:G3E family GTPase